MSTLNISSGTILKYQLNPCNNKTRLTENYYYIIENFRCQICSGGFFIKPVHNKLFITNSFILCDKYKTVFHIKKDYVGKTLICQFCLYEIKLSFLLYI